MNSLEVFPHFNYQIITYAFLFVAHFIFSFKFSIRFFGIYFFVLFYITNNMFHCSMYWFSLFICYNVFKRYSIMFRPGRKRKGFVNPWLTWEVSLMQKSNGVRLSIRIQFLWGIHIASFIFINPAKTSKKAHPQNGASFKIKSFYFNKFSLSLI